MIKHLLLSGFTLLLSACSATGLLNASSDADAYLVEQDVAYGSNPRLKLDIYRGESARCRIVFVYGGSWQQGEKSMYGFVGAELAQLGYEVVIPDYRLYPEVAYPAFVQDIALSIQYLESNYPTTAPLVLMGHSAGAMIASMISYDPEYLRVAELNPGIVQANIAIAGPHDYFLPSTKPKWRAIFGETPEQQIEALAVNHVSSIAPASLILHGSADNIVTPKSAVSMAQKLDAAGANVTLKLYDGVGHRRVIGALASPLQSWAPTLTDIDEFLETHGCGQTDK